MAAAAQQVYLRLHHRVLAARLLVAVVHHEYSIDAHGLGPGASCTSGSGADLPPGFSAESTLKRDATLRISDQLTSACRFSRAASTSRGISTAWLHEFASCPEAARHASSPFLTGLSREAHPSEKDGGSPEVR
ncbi:hypothetical protein D3C83_31350 [compost metagenome]